MQITPRAHQKITQRARLFRLLQAHLPPPFLGSPIVHGLAHFAPLAMPVLQCHPSATGRRVSGDGPYAYCTSTEGGQGRHTPALRTNVARYSGLAHCGWSFVRQRHAPCLARVADTADPWHAPLRIGTGLLCAAAGQWHALLDYGRHRRPVARSTFGTGLSCASGRPVARSDWLVCPTLQASGTL